MTVINAIIMAKDNPNSKYAVTDSIITCGVTVFARAICRINKTTIKSKKKIFVKSDTLFSTERFNNADNHSIEITNKAMLKIRVRYLLSASAESKKINVKQKLYNTRCHSAGKKGIKNIVMITKSNRIELLVVKNLFEMFEKNFILYCFFLN